MKKYVLYTENVKNGIPWLWEINDIEGNKKLGTKFGENENGN